MRTLRSIRCSCGGRTPPTRAYSSSSPPFTSSAGDMTSKNTQVYIKTSKFKLAVLNIDEPYGILLLLSSIHFQCRRYDK